MANEEPNGAEARSFLTCVAEVAGVLGIKDVSTVAERRRARHLAHAVRRPLLERANLPEEFFAPLMAAAVYDPVPSFCRWFVEPALYAFGRRRVLAALIDYLRTGTDAEQAGAVRAWYCAHLPLRAGRLPAYGPGGRRDPALDESRDLAEAWWEASMRVLARTSDPRMHQRVLLGLPASRAAYPPRLHNLLELTLASARTHPEEPIRNWAATVGQDAT